MDIKQKVVGHKYYGGENHQGKVKCSLCNVACEDIDRLFGHFNGQKHAKNEKRLERDAFKRQREDEAQRAMDDEARQRRENLHGSFQAAVAAPYGKPEFMHQTETVANGTRCKVWLSVEYPKASDGTRPLYRWKNAREQEMEAPDEHVLYLLVACEGYQTIAFTFPKAPITGVDDIAKGEYKCNWDPQSKKYSLFFVVG